MQVLQFRTDVSILLLLEIGLKVKDLEIDLRKQGMFQSFFYWKSASKLSTKKCKKLAGRCFNPSSIGNRPQSCRILQTWRPRTPVSILLLLEIGLKVTSILWSRARAKGFNPSSIGNRPQRRVWYDYDSKGSMFQSFFYWKSASKTLPPFRGTNGNYGVSILLLLEIGLKVISFVAVDVIA